MADAASLDRPDVIVFPPAIPLATLATSAVLQWFAPIGLIAHMDALWRIAIGTIVLVSGLVTASAGRRALLRGKTNINPSLPTTGLVIDGIFGYSRNPLYVGGSLALCGIALLFDLDWMLFLILPACILLHFAVVLREERYLEQKFGDVYRRYKLRVPRYFFGN
ncbi:methyltransferase family protein [Bradyrhizobium erythrophlei]|uniref:methyltransferase family protein n=1 Tax=Bradyrhizobium erythrophlei TaxID=1437360 RepID=UPI0035EAF9FF